MTSPPSAGGDPERPAATTRVTAPGPRGLLAAAGSIAAITLVARVVGFGRWFVFSTSVGATDVGTAYQSVNAVPNVLFEVAAGGVLAAVAVPLVASALARGDEANADRTASALLTWALVLLLPIGLIVALAAEPIAGALLSGERPGQVALGADLLRIFSIQIPLYGVAIVLAAVLQSHRRFVAAAVAPLLSSVLVIATYIGYGVLVDQPGAEISAIPSGAKTLLGVGTTLGVVALSLPLLVPIRRAGISLRPTLSVPRGIGGRLRTLAIAGLLGVVGQQVATLVAIRLANERGQSGTINVYTYTQAITLLPYAVLAVPIATTAFPALADAAARRQPSRGTPLEDSQLEDRQSRDRQLEGPGVAGKGSAERTLRSMWAATLAVGTLGAAVLAAMAEPIARFFTGFDAGSRDVTTVGTLAAMGDAVTLMAPSVLALSVIGLLSRASYVRGRAVVAGAAVGTAWLATTVTPLLTLDPAGAGGPRALRMLSLGTSLGLLAGAVVLVVLVVRAWGSAALALPWRTAAAIVAGPAGGAIMGRVLATWLVESTPLGEGLLGPALAAGLVGLVAAGIAAALALAVDPSVRLLAPRRRSSTHGASR